MQTGRGLIPGLFFIASGWIELKKLTIRVRNITDLASENKFFRLFFFIIVN